MTTRYQLTYEARETLAAYGISVASWLRAYPDCDRCGCPDDRCIGYHHGEEDPGSCDLRYWIEEDIRTGAARPRYPVVVAYYAPARAASSATPDPSAS